MDSHLTKGCICVNSLNELAIFLFQRSAKWTPPSPIHFPKNSGFRTFLRDLAGSIWGPAKTGNCQNEPHVWLRSRLRSFLAALGVSTSTCILPYVSNTGGSRECQTWTHECGCIVLPPQAVHTKVCVHSASPSNAMSSISCAAPASESWAHWEA